MVTFNLKSFSLSSDQVIEAWKDFSQREKYLMKRYNLSPNDSLSDIWVDFKKPRYMNKNLPQDIILSGGIGDQDLLNFYYSPSKGYFVEGELLDSLKVDGDGLKDLMIKTLKEEIVSLKKVGASRNEISFQEENIKMLSSKSIKF